MYDPLERGRDRMDELAEDARLFAKIDAARTRLTLAEANAERSAEAVAIRPIIAACRDLLSVVEAVIPRLD